VCASPDDGGACGDGGGVERACCWRKQRSRDSDGLRAWDKRTGERVRPRRQARRWKRMSLAFNFRTGTTRQRNSYAQYWTFFSKDTGTFWDFLARSREERQTQPSPSWHTATTSATGAPESAQHSTTECWSASPRPTVSPLMIPLVYCPLKSCRDRTAARATLGRELPTLALSICEVGA
jgi:hypothetical protein